MDEQHVTLADLSDEPSTLVIGEREIPLRRLKVGDFAAAEQHLMDMRLNTFIKKANTTPFSDTVVGQAMSSIICTPVGTTDPWASAAGESFLIQRMMQVNGAGPSLKWVQDEMPPLERKLLTKMLLWAARIPQAQKERAAPLAHTTASETS